MSRTVIDKIQVVIDDWNNSEWYNKLPSIRLMDIESIIEKDRITGLKARFGEEHEDCLFTGLMGKTKCNPELWMRYPNVCGNCGHNPNKDNSPEKTVDNGGVRTQ